MSMYYIFANYIFVNYTFIIFACVIPHIDTSYLVIPKFLLCLQPSVGTVPTCTVTTSCLSKRWSLLLKANLRIVIMLPK